MDLFELDSGNFVAFVGTMGDRGVLHIADRSGWTYHAPGTTTWDFFHQLVYRNHKASRAESAALSQLGYPPPPVEQHDKPVKQVEWADQFNAELAVGRLPASLRGLASGSVWLILHEDLYESSLGDGRAVYPHAAFRSETAARQALAAAKKGQFDAYVLREIPLTVDAQHVRADLRIERYEHYSIDDIVRLLAGE
jgi:hypothetical protein